LAEEQSRGVGEGSLLEVRQCNTGTSRLLRSPAGRMLPLPGEVQPVAITAAVTYLGPAGDKPTQNKQAAGQ